MRIKKNDTVLVITGKDKGKQGKTLRVLPKIKKVLVENINLVKKHLRPKRGGEKGHIVQIPKPIDVSNLKLICPKCGQTTRVGYKITMEQKFRVCKKCGVEI